MAFSLYDATVANYLQILRYKAVPLGKRDFMGRLNLKM